MRRLFCRLIVAGLFFYLLVDFSSQHPGKSMYGQAINPPSEWKEADGSSFVIATYNIRRSKGLDGKRNIKRTVSVLEYMNADIIGLNEISGTLFYGWNNQAEQIGRMLDAGWLFTPTYRQFFQNHFGNGIVSHYPVKDWKVYPLLNNDNHDASFRNMVTVNIPFRNKAINVLNTHLDRSEARVEQLRQVLEHFTLLPSPAVLVGDLNTRPNDRIMIEFLSGSEYINVTQMINGKQDVEWIIAKGLTFVSGGIEPAGASDHPAYWAELAIK